MEKIKKHFIIKLITIALIVSFITLDISWAYPPEAHSDGGTLAPPSGFSVEPHAPGSMPLAPSGETTTFFGDHDLAGKASLANALLIMADYAMDKKLPLRYFADVMSNNRELGGIATNFTLLDGSKEGIVLKLGYVAVNGDEYVIEILKREDLTSPEPRATGPGPQNISQLWQISDKYIIRVMALSEVRGQRLEDRGQLSEGRSQRSEVSGEKREAIGKVSESLSFPRKRESIIQSEEPPTHAFQAKAAESASIVMLIISILASSYILIYPTSGTYFVTTSLGVYSIWAAFKYKFIARETERALTEYYLAEYYKANPPDIQNYEMPVGITNVEELKGLVIARSNGYRHQAFKRLPIKVQNLIILHEVFKSHFTGMLSLLPGVSVLVSKLLTLPSGDREPTVKIAAVFVPSILFWLFVSIVMFISERPHDAGFPWLFTAFLSLFFGVVYTVIPFMKLAVLFWVAKHIIRLFKPLLAINIPDNEVLEIIKTRPKPYSFKTAYGYKAWILTTILSIIFLTAGAGWFLLYFVYGNFSVFTGLFVALGLYFAWAAVKYYIIATIIDRVLKQYYRATPDFENYPSSRGVPTKKELKEIEIAWFYGHNHPAFNDVTDKYKNMLGYYQHIGSDILGILGLLPLVHVFRYKIITMGIAWENNVKAEADFHKYIENKAKTTLVTDNSFTSMIGEYSSLRETKYVEQYKPEITHNSITYDINDIAFIFVKQGLEGLTFDELSDILDSILSVNYHEGYFATEEHEYGAYEYREYEVYHQSTLNLSFHLYYSSDNFRKLEEIVINHPKADKSRLYETLSKGLIEYFISLRKTEYAKKFNVNENAIPDLSLEDYNRVIGVFSRHGIVKLTFYELSSLLNPAIHVTYSPLESYVEIKIDFAKLEKILNERAVKQRKELIAETSRGKIRDENYDYVESVGVLSKGLERLDTLDEAVFRDDIERKYNEHGKPISEGGKLQYSPAQILSPENTFEVIAEDGVKLIGSLRASIPVEKRDDKRSAATHIFNIRGGGYTISPRRRPYGMNHFTIGKRDKRGTQKLESPDQIELLLRMARIMGDGYEVFFNGVGASKDEFHAQFLRKVSPLWNDSGHIKLLKGNLNGISYFTGRNPEQLSSDIFEIWKYYFDRGIRSDIFVHSSGEEIEVYLIPRNGKTAVKATADNGSFGDFGALEIAGYILNVKDRDTLKVLQSEPHIYRDSLREMSIDEGDVYRSPILEEGTDEGIESIGNFVNNTRADFVAKGNRVLDFLDSLNGSAEPMGDFVRLEGDETTASVIERLSKAVSAVEALRDSIDVPDSIVNSAEDVNSRFNDLESGSIVSSLLILARKAKRENQNVILGIETDWVPGSGRDSLGYSSVNPLIKEIASLDETLRKMGLDNVIIIHTGAGSLAEKLKEKVEATGTNLRHVIAVGSIDTIRGHSFDQFRLVQDPRDMAFLAGIDTSKLDAFEEDGFMAPMVNLTGLLSLIFEIASGKKAPDMGLIYSYSEEERLLILLPEFKLLEIDKFKDENRLKRLALKAA